MDGTVFVVKQMVLAASAELAASCLLYNSQGECVERVDAARTSATGLQGIPMVRYSGSTVDKERNEARRILNIESHAFPSEVGSMYFVVSTTKQIRAASVPR